MTTGTILFLNGTSSAGKTSIARVLQHRLDAPYVHLAVDQFISSLPRQYLISDYVGHINPTFGTLVSGFHHCIAALAAAGNNVLVDHVLQESAWWWECASVLAPLHARLITVHCSLAELEQRERRRGDRAIGLARFQYARVYGNGIADLRVDTQHQTAEACAAQIHTYLGSDAQPDAFQRILTTRTDHR